MEHLFWGSHFDKVYFDLGPLKVCASFSYIYNGLSFLWKGGNAVLSLSLYAKSMSLQILRTAHDSNKRRPKTVLWSISCFAFFKWART